MNNNEQSNDQSDNSKDKTMEIDEQPKIKGFKHKYQELQQTMAINNQDLKEIEAPIPQKKDQDEVAIAQIQQLSSSLVPKHLNEGDVEDIEILKNKKDSHTPRELPSLL